MLHVHNNLLAEEAKRERKPRLAILRVDPEVAGRLLMMGSAGWRIEGLPADAQFVRLYHDNELYLGPHGALCLVLSSVDFPEVCDGCRLPHVDATLAFDE